MNSLGEQLKIGRDTRGLTLREVSEVLKIDQSLISKYEKNERKPTREQVIKLAEFYCLSTDALLNDWHSDKIVEGLMDCSEPDEVLKIVGEKIDFLRKGNDEK